MSLVAGKRVAIANRGEIAVRIAATCRRLGAIPMLLIGEPDLNGYAARQGGRIELVGEAGSELDVTQVVEAARRAGADFLHPGYGFLSERAALAEACDEAGIRFVGPSAATLRLCGDKLATRTAAKWAGVPVLAASDPLDDDPDSWRAAAREIGYPLLVKPAEAGGGRGLRHVADESTLVEAVRASRRESASSGAGAIIYLERELVEPRHVEVQVAADEDRILVVGDRDCSIQRRHQKVIEEAPAPNISQKTRDALHEYARRIAQATQLRGIATCEFLLGADGQLVFLEVNPRIQVEHPVTELVTGIDLVEWQLIIAAGGSLPMQATLEPRGHAIEARVYAEDPWAGFFPAPGRLSAVSWPARPDIRIDAGYASGDQIPAAYDPMVAKVCAHGVDRDAAIASLRLALLDTVIAGVHTNLPWLLNLLDHRTVRDARATTKTAGVVEPMMPNRFLASVAAAAYLIDGSASRGDDAWSAIGPWRMSGRSTITFHGDDWEERVTAWRATEGWHAALDSSPVPIRWWRDVNGVFTVASEDAVMRAAVIERNDVLEVNGGGGWWSVHPGPRPVGAVARRERASDGRVVAPLPASVLSIHVNVGDQVGRGQPLVTLSAMKMELTCEAPIDGVVETISCQVNDLVSADQLLATVRSADAVERND